jgi:hypothetical protein
VAKATATGPSIEEALARLGKPRIKYVLRLVQFLGRLLAEGGQAARAMQGVRLREANADAAVFGAVLTSLNEEQLAELGQILLQSDEVVVRPDDVDLVWLTEALAVWAETCNLPQIVKNVQRVAAAVKA